ncbi:MAG: hypothetical protein K2W95_26140 [Candidatus Obscuribacterales bacterium]|nr:hypothetical protein [Candidatus Obscuribacterales bacterium]
MNAERSDFFSGIDGGGVATATDLLNEVERLYSGLSESYNRTIAQEPLMLGLKRSLAPDRLIVANSLWALSLRSSDDTVECYLIPCAEQSSLQNAELPSRRKLRMQVRGGDIAVDDAVVDAKETATLFCSLLNDVIARSQREFETMSDSVRLVFGGQSLTGSVRSLVAEKDVLVRKIVNQQEAILAQVARDLHDAVLGNMLVLERSFGGGRRLGDEEVVKIVREASVQLREICHDLYPRDLKDCGLKPMLQELCTRLAARTMSECTLVCEGGDVPDLPDEVLLHVYRIAQECCNNIAKHASATVVTMVVNVDSRILEMQIIDNGVGFDLSPPGATVPGRGGGGTSIIRERAALIDSVLPCRLFVDSFSDQGTKITLLITYSQ